MKKMKYHDNPIAILPTNTPEVIVKEVIKEVLVYQPPQIITREIPSIHLTEEINRLTQRLAEKDEIIHQMNFEKIELISKLNVSEVSKSSLMDELTGLKEDKADLRADKARLHEEMALLRKSELINQENILQKTLELELLNKMFNESSIANNSFLQEEKQEPIINNLEIPLLHISNSLVPNQTVESIYTSEKNVLDSSEVKIELSGNITHSFDILD